MVRKGRWMDGREGGRIGGWQLHTLDGANVALYLILLSSR
jgi:hypothetical protein